MDCDLLLSGGGSLLQDITSKRSLLYYLFILALGLLLKKKVMLFGQGIGPIHNRLCMNCVASVYQRKRCS